MSAARTPAASRKPRVVLLRGHSANLWDLRPYERLVADYDISVLVTGSNLHRLDGLGLREVPTRSVRDWLPGRRVAGAVAYALGERYLGLRERLAGADVVHSAEIGTWFSAQAAQLRDELKFKLALTVWETLPWGTVYRWPRERRYRRAVLPAADMLLPATERARRCLELEGADPARIMIAPPGIELDRFAPRQPPAQHHDGHLLLSVGRLVWEKGHQDVIRALGALTAGIGGASPRSDLRLLVVGDGPEAGRLRAHARELGVADRVEFRATVPYDEMRDIYSLASALVLASLPTKAWEEQFGMVLVEGMAAGVPIVAAASGAIPEVLAGQATLFEPGDWAGLAAALAAGPLTRPPAERRDYDPGLLRRYSGEECAARLRAAYGQLLADGR
jgi:glycosyltransferase involved in cell wall biosynthesis